MRAALLPAITARRFWLGRRSARYAEVVANLRDLLVEDPVIRLDEFDGVFSLDRHSDLFSRVVTRRTYEPELVAVCARHLDRDRDVIDVGANIGFYSVLFACNLAHGRRVIAVEPTRNALRRLRRNLELNGVTDRVTVVEGVISSQSGKVEIKTIRGREEYSSIGRLEHPSVAGEEWVTEPVTATTLDALVATTGLDPGFLKVDVEGVEHLVFDGARDVLSRYRPVILSELSDPLLRANGSSARQVIEQIARCGYEVLDPVDPAVPAGTREYGDILCLPR